MYGTTSQNSGGRQTALVKLATGLWFEIAFQFGTVPSACLES